MRSVVHTIVKNLNKIIDINFYPVPETKRSNMRHRPIGIGVQGLADLFAELHYDFEGEKQDNSIEKYSKQFITLH